MPKIIKTKTLKKRNQKYNEINPILAYILCSIKGLICFVVICLFLAYVIFKGKEFSVFYKILSYFSVFAGGFLSGYLADKAIKGRGYINGAVSSALYCVLVLIFSSVFLKFNVSSSIALLIPLCVIGGFSGGIVSANKK